MEPENGPVKAYFEPVVCVSELVNWQCEVPELQLFKFTESSFLGISEALRKMILATSCIYRALS